jgi:hypothetical protein
MKVDWIITIVFFLAFVAWAFTFYASLFTEEANPLGEAVDIVNDRVVNFLTIEVYEVPIRYNSTNETNNSVLFFNFTWPDQTKNSTRMLQNSASLPCQMSGDTIYWQANLTNLTLNYFTMQFSNKTSSVNCSDSFTIQNELHAMPWTMEKKRLVSQDKINEMTGLSYPDFKSSLPVSRDFRVELNISGTVTNYGLTEPLIRDVYVRETYTRIDETEENVTVRVLVW